MVSIKLSELFFWCRVNRSCPVSLLFFFSRISFRNFRLPRKKNDARTFFLPPSFPNAMTDARCCRQGSTDTLKSCWRRCLKGTLQYFVYCKPITSVQKIFLQLFFTKQLAGFKLGSLRSELSALTTGPPPRRIAAFSCAVLRLEGGTHEQYVML